MKIAIMQPYFFPYIGYWQLINAVDKYVIYDDVNYIKRGWISRNKILINGEARYICLSLQHASRDRLINETKLMESGENREVLLKTIQNFYKKAPFFKEVYPIVEKIILNDEKNLANYLSYSIKRICEYLNINTEILLSSSIKKNNNLRCEDKILEICTLLKANWYINAIGGHCLYSKENFDSAKIQLNFLVSQEIKYKQFKNEFISKLSIIDVMMFNSVEDIKKMLQNYELK